MFTEQFTGNYGSRACPVTTTDDCYKIHELFHQILQVFCLLKAFPVNFTGEKLLAQMNTGLPCKFYQGDMLEKLH